MCCATAWCEARRLQSRWAPSKQQNRACRPRREEVGRVGRFGWSWRCSGPRDRLAASDPMLWCRRVAEQ